MSAGGDAKYGRLFTKDDVLRILRYGGDSDWSEIMEEFDGPGGRGLTFPPDEPLFLLRGQDKAAPDAICTRDESMRTLDYYEAAHRAGADVQHLDAVSIATHRMREWQATHPARVKVPD